MAQKPVIHADDHRPKGFLGPSDPGGADPIQWPVGLVAGFGGVDLAVTQPGGLMFRYQLGEASGDAVDTSGFAGGPLNLTYSENTGGTSGGESWSSGHAATRQVMDHTEFGTGDDGSVLFNYKQLTQSGGAHNYPGAKFSGSLGTLVRWGTSASHLQSLSVFFKPTSGGLVDGCICGTAFYGFVNGVSNWLLSYKASDDTLHFRGSNASGHWDVDLSPPGSLTPGDWYHCAITWDGATYTMYLNGVVVNTVAWTADLFVSNNDFTIGNSTALGPTFGNADGYFYGEVDEIDGYDVVLTLEQVQAIRAARGGGFGSTISSITIGSGDPITDPGAISAGSSSQYDVLQSKGDGTTEFARARVRAYHNGV